jgi:hypothetical protein
MFWFGCKATRGARKQQQSIIMRCEEENSSLNSKVAERAAASTCWSEEFGCAKEANGGGSRNMKLNAISEFKYHKKNAFELVRH